MGGRSQEADSVLLEAARAMMAISVRAAAAVPGGISAIQLRALTVLSGLEQTNLADLGAALGMSPSSTSRLCDRLVARGLVDRQVSARTRREVALSLSEPGRRLLAEYDRRGSSSAIRNRIAVWTPSPSAIRNRIVVVAKPSSRICGGYLACGWLRVCTSPRARARPGLGSWRSSQCRVDSVARSIRSAVWRKSMGSTSTGHSGGSR